MIEALVLLAVLVGGLVLLPLLLLKLVLGVVLLPFKLLGLVFRLVFGLLSTIAHVVFSAAGLVFALLFGAFFLVLLPLLPILLLGLGIWVLTRLFSRGPALVRA